MILDKPIETERLLLRSLDPEAVDARYVGWLNDPAINRYLEVRHARQDLAGVKDYVRQMNASKTSLLLGIFLKTPAGRGPHIGNIKLGPIDPVHRHAHIGFLIGEKTRWGQGYTTEAVRALTRYGHEKIGLVKVTAGCYAANAASARVFLKLGYVQEARLRDQVASGAGRDDQLLFAHFPDAAKP